MEKELEVDVLDLPGKWRDGQPRERLWELYKDNGLTEEEILSAKQLERQIVEGDMSKLVRFVYLYKTLYKGEREVTANTLSFER